MPENEASTETKKVKCQSEKPNPDALQILKVLFLESGSAHDLSDRYSKSQFLHAVTCLSWISLLYSRVSIHLGDNWMLSILTSLKYR